MLMATGSGEVRRIGFGKRMNHCTRGLRKSSTRTRAGKSLAKKLLILRQPHEHLPRVVGFWNNAELAIRTQAGNDLD